MTKKKELLDYCDYIQNILNSQLSDAMRRAFVQWISILPDENFGITAPIESKDYPQQAFLLSFAPDVEISFSIPNILDQYDKGGLNTSKIRLLSLEDIVYSEERTEPVNESPDTIFAVKFPAALSNLCLFKDYIIDGNKRISSAIRSNVANTISYNLIEPHSFYPWCFKDAYSHFILLYTYDMVLSAVHQDPMGILFRIGAETIPLLTKSYARFLKELTGSSAS